MAERHQLLLRDVVAELRLLAHAAGEQARSDDEAFHRGRQFGLYEAASLIANQATAFGVDLVAIGLGSDDLEAEFLVTDAADGNRRRESD